MKKSLKMVSNRLCFIKKELEILMHLMATRQMKDTGLAIGKVIKGNITRERNYLQSESNDLMTLVLHGNYLKKSLKKAFRKHCFTKKAQAILMSQLGTKHLKVSCLASGKVHKGAIIRKGSYLKTELSDLRQLASNGESKDKVLLTMMKDESTLVQAKSNLLFIFGNKYYVY